MIRDITLFLHPNILSNHGLSEGDKIQRRIDSETLRYCDPYTPKITGNLIQSGIRGTVIGSGEVVYNAPYAAKQYYETAQTRSYDPLRGAYWFERMKADHKDDILRSVQKDGG